MSKARKPAARQAKSAARKPAAKKTEAAAAKAKPGRKTLGGPELKLPSFKKPAIASSIKAPAPVAGIVSSLRERRLLPVVILLLVAIVAAPFVLGNGKEVPEVKAPVLGGDGAVLESSASVVPVGDTGIREYEERLAGDGRDPFTPQYEDPAHQGSAAGGEGGEGDGGASASGSGGATGGAPAGSGVEPGSGGRVWLTHTADLYAASVNAKHAKLREGVEAGEVLPNRKLKLAAFMGVPLGAPEQGWFVLSGDVEIVNNGGKCALGSTTCEVVALKAGQSLKLRTLSGRAYVIKVVAINRVITTETPE